MTIKRIVKAVIPDKIVQHMRSLRHRMGESARPISNDLLGFGPHDQFSGITAGTPISTVAPFHNSIGDISTALVTQQYLSAQGIPSYMSSFWDNKHETIVIGGGEIIGNSRDPHAKAGSWRYVKPLFLPEGHHILNAVGYDLSADQSLLPRIKQYRYVSVRDHEIAEIFTKYRDDVAIVPCPATLQMGLPLELIQALPRYQMTSRLRAGDYIVVHRHPTLANAAARLRRKGECLVVVDMQAHAQHPWSGRDIIIPPTHSPEIIMGLVRSAKAVLTSSLHLAIFAIGASKPFAAVSEETSQSDKVRRYLRRAGIEGAMAAPTEDMLDVAKGIAHKLPAISVTERALASQHLATIKDNLL